MSKARLEAFSDGVIAIAITLLVLDIHVPEPAPGASLAERLGHQWPSYVAYIVSFVTIGIIWINHTAMLRRLASVDHTVMFLNLLLLLTIGVLPFSTALLAAYLKEADGARLAAVIYGGSFLLMGLTFLAMQRQLMSVRTHLLEKHVTPEVRSAVLRRNARGVFPYLLATIGALLTPYLTLAICAAVAGFYALPTTTRD